MLTAIEGTYENGKIELKRQPKTKGKVKVMVVFEEEATEPPTDTPPRRPFGLAAGAIHLSPDFDDPLDDLKDYM